MVANEACVRNCHVIDYIKEHFIGSFECGEVDILAPIEDVAHRYNMIDAMFFDVRKEHVFVKQPLMIGHFFRVATGPESVDHPE
jgi:hypothetical protein